MEWDTIRRRIMLELADIKKEVKKLDLKESMEDKILLKETEEDLERVRDKLKKKMK